MKKFEHLFSCDPMGAFEKIEDDYARYFEHAFKVKNEAVDEERMNTLKEGVNMSKKPYIELLPEYASVKGIGKGEEGINKLAKKFADAFGGEEIAKSFFSEFISKGLMRGLMKDFTPYGHQIGMMEKAFAGEGVKYKNTVITAGTGSGKTESFLLPLLANIFKEAQSWGQAADHKKWYEGVLEGRSRTPRYTPKQREGDPRPAALRAIVLYPMNALVEDQMARLREALDSTSVRTFMDTHFKGNRFYFGGYNGDTIAKKNYDLLSEALEKQKFNKKRQEVAKQLKSYQDDFSKIKTWVKDNKKEYALYISPRLEADSTTAEMITRWDMQNWAPDIMITNTTMLGIMLMRKAEAHIFEQTKKWLNADDISDENEKEEAKKNRIFHIVVDELHLYRGTAGSEVACLLRMLYDAIGLPPVIVENGYLVPNPQLRILASSASLGDEDATEKFMEEFFGVYSTIEGEKVFNIQEGTNREISDEKKHINYELFNNLTHENFVELEGDDVADKQQNVVNDFLKNNFNCNSVKDFCDTYQNQIFYDFYSALPTNVDKDNKPINGSKRPISQEQLVKTLFNANEEALKGFFIFRGYVDKVCEDHKLPRFRFHKFFKYIEGLWGELNPDLNRPVKHLSYTAEEVGKDGNKVLELLRCENCGELYIGGNRKVEDERTYLTLNYPNLNQIPNFNPTPMVQNKSYQEYAIFWPHDINDAPELTSGQGGNDYVAKINGNTNLNQNYGQAKWISGYLDPVTGEFIPKNKVGNNPKGIPGFIYKVVKYNTKHKEISPDAAQTIYAAPCTCPFCLQDYSTRKYTKSPIRSFRTGIDRSNQIISKELIYQLDDSSAKLIGFSDSREDAATQALGIEREHYRDMVRMLFVECIEEMGKEDIDKVVNYVNSERQVGTHSFDILTKVSNKFKDILNAVEIANRYLRGQSISHLIPSVFPLNTLIGENCDGRLVKKLLDLGINPAGWEYQFQWYKEGKIMRHWSTAYDFTNYKFTAYFWKEYSKIVKDIRTQLTNAIFANSFGKYMGVSVLDSGIGYICCSRSAEIENSKEYKNLKRILLPTEIQVYEFVDAVIRVMGDNYLYPSIDDTTDRVTTYGELKAAVKNPIKHFCRLHNINDTDLGNSLVNFLRQHCTQRDDLILDIDKLSFQKMTDSTYIKCEKCGRVHPHMGFGFCTNVYCKEPLDPKKDDPKKTVTLEELHKHYISHDILVERRKPSKLHTEELTGQTDDIQTRLREFKDIILVDDDFYKQGQEKTLPIDMVCVTTTMDVGVDIGSLQAIFQGNMPPTRYNYQQRVGRCGRRKKAFSTAFTFCRGRSHDVYYYNHATDEMVGGVPATPALSLAPYTDSNGKKKMKMAIMKRVIVKDLLHQAFANLPFDYDLQDTSGEFGRIGEWEENGKRLEEWIQDNPESVDNTVKRYLSQFNNGDQIKKDIKEIVDWINNSLVTEINNVVNKTSIHDMGLAKYLTETGFLPMYGMPSDARNFYHGYDYEKQEPRSIDRSSEMAISEFAPGAEKTKDKGKYRIEGITIPIKNCSYDGTDQLGFYDNDGDALADRYIISFEKDLENNSAEGNNISDIIEVKDKNQEIEDLNKNLTDNQRIIVIPQAYRSLKIMDNRGTPEENNDRGSSFVQSQIWAKETSTTKEDISKEKKDIPKEIDNVSVSMHGLGMNEDPTVWHINSNNGHFYTGSFSANGLGDPKKRGSHANFLFYEESGNNVQKITNGYDIALGSKKVTEMIKLKLKSWPECLDLSLNTGNRSAIRAAFYSAAFLLQRALADRLDVQPDEIEICEKIDDPNGCPAIILSDALANGAGIVSYLFEDGKLKELIESIVNFKSFDPSKSDEESFMHSLITDDHKENCLTACQKCLLAYNNRGFHHVLDWRLGVGILRLMIDPEFDFGFSCNNIDEYQELANQNRVFEMAAKKLNMDDSEHKHYWITNGRRGKREAEIIYHPLWNKEAAIKNCKNIPTDATIKMYNTFRLLRSDISADDNPENIADIIGNQAAQPTPATTSNPVANATPKDTDVNNIAPDIDLD